MSTKNPQEKPRKQRVYVGTFVVVASSLRTAQSEFNKSTEHVCNEDLNPFDTMLEWASSKEHDICPDCGSPNHKVKGHYCGRMGRTVLPQENPRQSSHPVQR